MPKQRQNHFAWHKSVTRVLCSCLLVPTLPAVQVLAYNENAQAPFRSMDPALGISEQFGRWDGPINLVYDPDGAPDLYADDTEVLALLEAAALEWEQVSGIRFNVIGSDAGVMADDNEGPDGKDGLVRVYWGNTGGAAGQAGPAGDFFDTDKGYYPYIDGNIELNENPDIWVQSAELLQVLVHELGHLMGLGHSDNPNSVMYANPYNHLQHPRADDILAARAMYGLGSLDIADITQPLDQWLYAPLPTAPASVTEYLFKPNQASDSGAFISAGNDTPLTVIDDAVADNVFVRFNFGGIGNFNNNSDIMIDASVVFVDPFGYAYDITDRQIECEAGFACGGGWVSIATTHVIKSIPGQWRVYVIDDDAQTTLAEVSFTVDTDTIYNLPPTAELSFLGLSSTSVNFSLLVSDPEDDGIDVVWRPPGNLGDQNGDGFIDTEIIDQVQSGSTVSRDISFPLAGEHTFYIELNDDVARYDGSNPDSSSAGRGFRSLMAVTVNLPADSDGDVVVVSTFITDSSQSTGSGNGDETARDEVISAIAATSALQLVTTSDGSATMAGFSAGATRDAGSSTGTEFTDGDAITIAGSVIPQADDVGKPGEIFVVLYTNDPSIGLSFLNEDGNFQKWGGGLKSIEPAYLVSSLGESEVFEVFSGDVQSGLYRVFLGYSADGGPLHFNARAFRVTVD